MQNLHGFGLKLRQEHYNDILTTDPAIDWFEVLSENYLRVGGYHRYYLKQISERYPLTLHGVSLSLGGSDPLDYDYLAALKSLASEINACHVSDHLCWTSSGGKNSHDLLPLPYTQACLQHLVTRISAAQDYLQQALIIENVSSYLTYCSSEYSEWGFLAEVVKQSGCLLLLDVNNIYVSAINHGFKAAEYLAGLPLDRVAEIHLAGHRQHGDLLIDTHDAPICAEVWELYQITLAKINRPVPVLIERDDNIPPLGELIAELNHARKLASCLN